MIMNEVLASAPYLDVDRKGNARVRLQRRVWPERLFYTGCLLFQLAALSCFFVPAFLGVASIEDDATHGYHESAEGFDDIDLFSLAASAGILRVAAPSTLSPSDVSPYGPGFEQELLADFCRRNSYSLETVKVSSRDEAMELLRAGAVDLIVGFGGDTPESLERLLVEGPAYAQFKPILVYGAKADSDSARDEFSFAPIPGFDAAARIPLPRVTPTAIPGVAVANPAGDPKSEAKALLAAASSGTGQKADKLFSMAADLSQSVLGDNGDAMLLDPASYALWLPLSEGMRTGRIMNKTVAYHWFWRRDGRPDLDHELEAFWSDLKASGKLEEMTERYYGFLPKNPQPHDIAALADVVDGAMGEYHDALLKASEETKLDPLLIAAVIFQESRFNPGARSSTGVRGIMQLTQGTADLVKVDRLNPQQCILGGARYLRTLWDDLEGTQLSPWDRWCFALAAFNQGPGNLKKVLRHVDKDSTPTWSSVKLLYPKVAQQGLGSGGFRGNEAVAFVENVRYYYYILSGLAGVARPERQNLTALLPFSPDS